MDEKAHPAVELSIDARRLARSVLVCCVLVEVALVLLDYHVNYGRGVEVGAIRRLFNLAREDGLASWLATTQTLLIALTLWLIYVSARHRPALRSKALGWLVLALFFSYMAVDDGAQLHERLGSAWERWSRASGSGGLFPSYAWQPLFLPLFGLLGLFLLVFLGRELKAGASRALLVLAVSCLAAAVGLDFLEGLAREHPWNVYAQAAARFELEPWTLERFGKPAYDTLRHFSKATEEFLEMLAQSVLWFLLLRHLPEVAGELRVGFRGARSTPAAAAGPASDSGRG
jgi:hypothetical protein